ncbi:MAG: acetyl-CoA C-acetyltransferase [Bacteroidetes bacterium]|nr:acetyl-CoA C-acetyltransferase [Bacteroidota bacterium]
MSEAWILDAVRTPRGKGKDTGALAAVPAWQLGAQLLQELATRNQLDTTQVEDVLLGCVSQVGEQGADLAKLISLEAGWPHTVAGVTLNRFCGSGLEAVNLAAANLYAGMANLVVAGGIESMSRVPMGADQGPFYPGSPHQPQTRFIPQGVSAELIATLNGFSRSDLDTFALRSHHLAHQATIRGYFAPGLVPVTNARGEVLLAQDECIRPEATAEKMAALSLVFKDWAEKKGYDRMALAQLPGVPAIHYLHTAGNSSAIVDGAGAVLMGTAETARALGLRKRARIRSWAVVGSDPLLMLTGTVPATRKALQLAGLEPQDIDLYEVNEAFASVVLYFAQEMKLPLDKVNVNGGAIAMGHPLGATGSMLIGTLLDELERRQLQLGLVTMCIGAGMGIATVLERV